MLKPDKSLTPDSLLADGDYNQTALLILLGADGRIVGRTRKMGATDPAFLTQSSLWKDSICDRMHLMTITRIFQ